MQFTLATLCTEVTKGVVMTTFWKTIIKCYSVIYYLNKRKMIALDYKERDYENKWGQFEQTVNKSNNKEKLFA